MLKSFYIIAFIITFLQLYDTSAQSMNPNVTIHQVHKNLDGEYMPLQTILCSFDYVPAEQITFFNLYALDIEMQPIRIIDNIPLFDLEHMVVPVERLTRAADISFLGFPDGIYIEVLDIFYTITPEPQIELLELSITDFEPVWVVPVEINVGGGQIDPFFDVFNHLNFPPPLPRIPIIEPIFNRGCAVPNIDLKGGADINGCVPAATANSFLWMKETIDGINFDRDLREAYENFSNLMNRENGQTVSVADHIRAKLDFIEMYDLPIKVEFQSPHFKRTDAVKSTSGKSSATNANRRDSIHTELDYILEKGRNKCDVELWLYDGGAISHVVTLTGAIRIINGNDTTYSINFKHDYDQDWSDEDRELFGADRGTIQENSNVVQADGGRYGRISQVRASHPNGTGNTGNYNIQSTIAECYDPNHKPRPKTLTMTKYCQNEVIIVPPKKSLVVKYPNPQGRCFNSTIYTGKYEPNARRNINHTRDRAWNFNGGKERRIANNDSVPIFVTIHNDDNRSPRDGSEGNNFDITYEIAALNTMIKDKDYPLEGTSDPSNEEDYAGFSIGWSDQSSDEFGSAFGSNSITEDLTLGFELERFPKMMKANTIDTLTINYQIKKYNIYWTDLELVVGVANVSSKGWLYFASSSNGVKDSILISSDGVYNYPLGKCNSINSFDIQLIAGDGLNFEFDFFAVPSIREWGWADSSLQIASINKSGFCYGDTLIVTANVIEPFEADNKFYLEVAMNPDFATYLPVDSVSGKTMNDFWLIIPPQLPPGDYYLRIKGTSPEYITGYYKVTLYPTPDKPTITKNDNVLVASDAFSYIWFKDNQEITGENAKQLDITNRPGTYSVIVVNENGCKSEMSDRIVIEPSTVAGVNDGIEIYPIPAQNIININLVGNSNWKQIELRNLLGEIIDVKSVMTENSFTFTTKSLPDGIYFIILSNESERVVKKVIISK